MALVVTIANGFAGVDAGLWLMGHGQPAAFFGSAVRRRRKGWCVRDRSLIDLVETTGAAKCADSSRPFLTHIPCAAPVFAVSGKVLVAPAGARKGASAVKTVPMSMRHALCATEFGSEWVVMATLSRTGLRWRTARRFLCAPMQSSHGRGSGRLGFVRNCRSGTCCCPAVRVTLCSLSTVPASFGLRVRRVRRQLERVNCRGGLHSGV